MSQSLRLLMVEDSDSDAALLLHALHQGGYEVTSAVVQTPVAMRAALKRQEWDVITSDHAMPAFSAPAAMALAKTLRPGLPFIIVSGQIDLSLAVSLMRNGADDYVEKRELPRVIPAIERALRQVELRRERQEVRDALEVSETRYRRLFETAQDGILILDAISGAIDDVNPFLMDMLGYSKEEFVGKKLWEIGAFRDTVASKTAFEELREKGYVRYEDLPLQAGNGRLVAVEFVSNVYAVDHTKVAQCNIRDITKRKKAEQALAYVMQAVMSTRDAIGISDAQGHHVFQNTALSELFGYATAEELEAAGGGPAVVKDPVVAREMFGNITHGKSWVGELEMVTKSGRVFPAHERADAILDAAGNIVGLIGIITDITERKRADEALRATLAENENLVAELRHTIAQVKTLRGMLPICAWCRKIRSDDGYWNQIETYLAEHTDLTVSHGVCPDCYAKMMKDGEP